MGRSSFKSYELDKPAGVICCSAGVVEHNCHSVDVHKGIQNQKDGKEALYKIGFCCLLVFISVSWRYFLLSYSTLMSIPLYWSDTSKFSSKRLFFCFREYFLHSYFFLYAYSIFWICFYVYFKNVEHSSRTVLLLYAIFLLFIVNLSVSCLHS